MKKIRTILYALVLVCIIAAGVYPLLTQTPDDVDQAALIGGEFTLINQDGQTVSSSDFDGQYRLIYFGFSHCPNICPVDLAIMSEAMRLLPQEAADNVVPLFITVDPARDTPARLTEYLQAFDERFVGLTGSKEAIDAVVASYRVYAQKAPDPSAPDGYSMNHSGITYFMGPQGEFISHFNHETPPQEMANFVTSEVEKNPYE